MHIKSILAGAAIALAATAGAATAADEATDLVLVAGLGSASDGERFATIVDLSPQALSADELAEVRGAGFLLVNNHPLGLVAEIPMSNAVAIRICGENVCSIFIGRPHARP